MTLVKRLNDASKDRDGPISKCLINAKQRQGQQLTPTIYTHTMAYIVKGAPRFVNGLNTTNLRGVESTQILSKRACAVPSSRLIGEVTWA